MWQTGVDRGRQAPLVRWSLMLDLCVSAKTRLIRDMVPWVCLSVYMQCGHGGWKKRGVGCWVFVFVWVMIAAHTGMWPPTKTDTPSENAGNLPPTINIVPEASSSSRDPPHSPRAKDQLPTQRTGKPVIGSCLSLPEYRQNVSFFSPCTIQVACGDGGWEFEMAPWLRLVGKMRNLAVYQCREGVM